jgi:hypothetical protein
MQQGKKEKVKHWAKKEEEKSKQAEEHQKYMARPPMMVDGVPAPPTAN